MATGSHKVMPFRCLKGKEERKISTAFGYGDWMFVFLFVWCFPVLFGNILYLLRYLQHGYVEYSGIQWNPVTPCDSVMQASLPHELKQNWASFKKADIRDILWKPICPSDTEASPGGLLWVEHVCWSLGTVQRRLGKEAGCPLLLHNPFSCELRR